jgi:hypothetical protein
MGIGSSRRSCKPEDLTDLLESSKKLFETYLSEKNDTLKRTKEEIENFLILKNINSSKEKMKKKLNEEDDIIIYEILNRIVQILKEKVTSLSENASCPIELKAPLNTLIYAAPKLKIKELKEFRKVFEDKYGSDYINKVDKDEEHLVNEVLTEKLKNRIYSDQLIKAKLKIFCEEKKIDSKFLDDINSSQLNNSSRLRKVNTIHSSLNISLFDRSLIKPEEREEIERNNNYTKSKNKIEEDKKDEIEKENIEEKKEENEDNNSDKLSEEFREIEKNDPFKRLKTLEDPENPFVIKEGKDIFSTYDENIDRKCYEINNIENWAESFYNIKTGIILDKYKELISKSEFRTFFEALNYEYGLNNCEINLQKAFDIYKKAADTTTDTLSMYRLYHIYKRDFAKFNIKERNQILELFYIMKCFTYLTSFEKNNNLFQRFNIGAEIRVLIMNEEKKFYYWYYNIFAFLQKNYSYYDIDKDDAILIEAIIYHYFEQKTEYRTDDMNDKFFNLIDKGNPHAIYNLLCLYPEEKNYLKYYSQLIDKNYYRGFADYYKIAPDQENALTTLKKSISNGYISHIKEYFRIFMLNNEIEDIVKSPELKSELIYIINIFIDNIIFDDIQILFDFIFMRNKLIKHYNLEEEFKKSSDDCLKEIINYLNGFMKGKDDENKNKIIKYFGKDYYSLIYTLYGNYCYLGIKGIMEKNYNETLKIYNYLLKKDDGFLIDRYYLYYIYMIKNKQRNLNKENKNEDKELIDLEKKLLNLFYNDISVEKIKTYPPSFFYYLSRLYRNNTIKTKDLILEYVFLNRASNAKIMELKNVDSQIFEDKYYIIKAKKKVAEKSKEENFKKIMEGKGAINIEGYGEDGIICPICLENKKSIIALPCKHFFCGSCMEKLLDDGSCPICRTQIKITFDITTKKESLIQSKFVPSGPYYDDELVDDPFDIASM